MPKADERPAPPSPWRKQYEAAQYARCGVAQIIEALRSGELVGHQDGPGKTWRIHVDDIDAWIRNRTAKSA